MLSAHRSAHSSVLPLVFGTCAEIPLRFGQLQIWLLCLFSFLFLLQRYAVPVPFCSSRKVPRPQGVVFLLGWISGAVSFLRGAQVRCLFGCDARSDISPRLRFGQPPVLIP
jgi:hypothetical protein